MFSGIVEEKGIVKKVQQKKHLLVVHIAAEKVLRTTKIGDSIAADGVCLTVTQKAKRCLTFDVMLETIKRTTLKNLKVGDHVNLERALKVGDRISGHFVSGHIDGVGTIEKKITKKNYIEYQISVPSHLKKYLASKGSICVDGISLTLGEIGRNDFSVYIIPHTLAVTTLGAKGRWDQVNIETDILAKYLFVTSEFESIKIPIPPLAGPDRPKIPM